MESSYQLFLLRPMESSYQLFLLRPMESSYQLYKTSIFCDLITIVDYSIYVGHGGRLAPQGRGACCPQHA